MYVVYTDIMISPKHSKTVWNSVILAKVSMSCWGTTFFCLLPCSVVAHSQRPTCLQKQTGLCLCDWPCKTTCRWCSKTTCSHVLHAVCRFHTLFMSSQLSSQNKITEHLNSSTSQRCAIAELWLGLLSNTEGWSADPDVSVQKYIVTWKQTLQTWPQKVKKVPCIFFPLRSALAENVHTWRKIASAGSRRPHNFVQVFPDVSLCSPFLNLRRLTKKHTDWDASALVAALE